jgi:hypothetical protein
MSKFVRAAQRACCGAAAAATMLLANSSVHAASDYPTAVTAEYVLVCMKSNGETRDALERCACAIDVIASILPYDRYVSAETFKRMGLVSGERGSPFRETAPARAAKADLSRAEIEADVRCF